MPNSYTDTNVSDIIFNVLDSNTYNSLIENNQVDNNQLYLITDDNTYLPFSGGTMTGTINRYYSSANGTPMLALRSNNMDATLLQIGHATSATGTFSNNYRLIYKGTGSSPNNYLQLIANTGSSSDVVAMQVNENGNVSFTNTVAASISGNAATATAFASAKSVALTGDVTGSASSTGGWSIATTIGTGKVTNAMLAGSIANEKLVNHKITIANNEILLGGSLDSTTLRASLGLSSAMHFIGKATVAVTDGSTTNPTISGYDFANNKQAGDVIIDKDNSREYVWSSEGKWEQLGPEGSYKVIQTAYTDSTGTSESTTATRFVYSISQDANGVVSVKTRPLPTYNNYTLPLAANGTRGGIQIGFEQSGKNYPVQLSSEKAYVNVPWTDITVKQTAKSDNVEYKMLMGANSNPTSGTAYEAVYDSTITLNPSTHTITAGHFKSEHQSGGGNEFRVVYSSTVDMALMVGSGDVNHGLYDTKASKWMIVADGSGNVTVNGNAATATALTSSAGGTEQPIYFSSGKPVATTYALKATVNNATQWGVAYYSTARNITSTAAGAANTALMGKGSAAPAFVSVSPSSAWTAGTTAGPSLKITVLGVTQSTGAVIPTATASASGIVTTDAQSFGGTKTFESTAASTSTSTGGVIVKGGIGVAGQVTSTRVGINGSNTSYNLYVNGSSLLTGVLTQNNTTDSAHSADTNASVVVKGGISVAKKVSAKEIRIDNSQQSKGVHLQYDETLEVLNFVFA